jgi:hypothetical protein
MLTWLAACFEAPTPPPAPEVAVEVRWPGASPEELDQLVIVPLDEALAGVPEVLSRRCEAIPGAARCVVTLEQADPGAVKAAVHRASWPQEVDEPVVLMLPEVPRQARWLVLRDAPVDELLAWHPGVWVERQWAARCDGEAAVALQIAAPPTAPPPPAGDVRTELLGPERVHVSGPDDAALDRVDAALSPFERCLVAERGRLDGWVLAPAAEVRARLPDPELEVVPGEAPSRRYRVAEAEAAALADAVRALDGVLTVRALAPREEPSLDVAIDGARAEARGLTAADVAAAARAALDAPGDPVEALRAATVGEVPLAEVATVSLVSAPALLVRIDGERAAQLDVLLLEDTPEARARVDAALSGAAPLEPWTTRLQRP